MSVLNKPQLLYHRQEIAAAVRKLAEQISRDYRDENPILIGILKGSFIFMADLVRLLEFPLEIDFIRLSSYGSGRQTSGQVKVEQVPGTSIKDRDVLVIEDIVDTGLTTAFLLDYLRQQAPASLRLCALLDKPARHRVPVNIDYLGFAVPDKFLVGYGLDYNQQYRHLPDICYLEET